MAAETADTARRPVSAEIVVGVDGSAGSARAVRWAAATAAARGRRLRLLHALDYDTTISLLGGHDTALPGVLTTLRTHGAEVVAAAAGTARHTAPAVEIETEVPEGNPARVLIERSAAAHLTVLGATGSGGAIAHLGSTLLKVVAHGHGAVVVVRDAEFEQRADQGGPVVVGIDGSEGSRAAVAAAFAGASERGAGLVALHAWADVPFRQFAGLPDNVEDHDIDAAARTLLTEQLAGWGEKYPDVTVQRRAYLSGPRPHLLAWSKTAQLLVVGSRGRGGFTGLLLGSTGNTLVQRAHCPVLVAHSE